MGIVVFCFCFCFVFFSNQIEYFILSLLVIDYMQIILYIFLTAALRGYCTPSQVFDCLCIFLKNYNTLVASKICFL